MPRKLWVLLYSGNAVLNIFYLFVMGKQWRVSYLDKQTPQMSYPKTIRAGTFIIFLMLIGTFVMFRAGLMNNNNTPVVNENEKLLDRKHMLANTTYQTHSIDSPPENVIIDIEKDSNWYKMVGSKSAAIFNPDDLKHSKRFLISDKGETIYFQPPLDSFMHLLNEDTIDKP